MKHDFSIFDTLLPHPVYRRMNRICILNPSEITFREKLLPLIQESYKIAKERFNKRTRK